MSERLNFAIDGEFLTNIARDWFWNMNKSYKKCEELLLSCMAGGSEEEKRHVCQDIIEGRKKLVGINEFELVDDNGKVRPLGQKVEELQRKMLVNQVREDMIAHPLKYLDRFAMPFDYDMFCRDVERDYIDGSYDGVKDYVIGDTGYTDTFNNGAWLLNRPDLVAEFNGDILPEQESTPDFYKTGFWAKLSNWIDENLKGQSVERRQRLYSRYINDVSLKHDLTEYGLIAPDGTWYACEFGEHAALAAASSCRIEKHLVFLTMKFSIWHTIGAAKVLISCTSAAGLRFGILRWAIRSSIWTRLIPQPKQR